MANMSVDCDCCAEAEDPCMKDIGILASTDPVAIDKACYDLIIKENTNGSNAWKDWADAREALNTAKVAEKHNIGTLDYNLIDVDNEQPDSKNDLWYVWYIIIPVGSVIIVGLIVAFIVIKIKKGKKETLLDENSQEIGKVVSTRSE